MDFPKRVYTQEEVKKAKQLIDNGYKHELSVDGTPEFESKVCAAMELIKNADYAEYIRTYIRSISEIDGLTQLRETEAGIWANKFAVANEVDFASLLVQKAFQMKEYLEGKLYYGGNAEKRSVEKRMEFLEKLKSKSSDQKIKDECERLLDMWKESSLAF